MQYYEWGDADNPRVLICVHGLTRNGRDFDFLARALESDFRVICPDIAGRGQSDWLASKADYGYPQYMADAMALIARVTARAVSEICWLGTSMGGILGMLLASLPKTPIRKLVVNDAGMLIPRAALERLALYVGGTERFASIEALEAHLRRICATFGPLSDDEWRHLAVHGAVSHPDGTWGMRYDPAIANAFQGELADVDLSPCWDAITCPTLLLRGADSDLLLRETALEMTQRGPCAKLVEIADVGHAPMLMSADEVKLVREFLCAP
jgi:pimeloyl-ACP methyl ester carboxylesterase